MNVLGCRFVYKTKRTPDRLVERWKARLVAQGFKQREGLDYNKTFTSTVNMQSVRIFLWIVTFYDLELFKIDIKTFFLYGELKETVYMKQPEGYTDDTKTDHVCRLKRSLYGTKQAMRCANEHLKGTLLALGFVQLMSDDFVYIKYIKTDYIILCNHVDDIACGGSSIEVCKSFITELSKTYMVKAEADPTVYLSLQMK